MNIKLINKLVLAIFFTNSLFSQENIDQLVVSSPNMVSLGKYINTPVGYYTGIPSIPIPIYNIKAKDFTLPINLGYHAGGIKVSEEASWVGLGWSLMAGGVITRSIRGIDDFGNGGYPYYQNQYVLPDYDNNINMVVANTNSSMAVAEFIDMRDQITDSEPDIFYFNFAGFSGKFFFEKCGTCPGNTLVPVLQNQDNLDIVYNKSTKDWIVTDVYGNKYFFGTEELTVHRSSTTNYEIDSNIIPSGYLYNGPKTTSWYLDQIITNKGEIISFDYNSILYTSQSQLSRSQKVARMIDFVDFGCPGTHWGCSIDTPTSLPNEAIVHGANLSLTNDIYLEKIHFPNGTLEFEKSPRIDIKKSIIGIVPNPQKLDRIKLYSSNSTTPLKTWELHQSYFERGTPNITEYFRLKLDSLTIKSKNDENDLSPYTFKYFEGEVPSKLTKDFDHWGYFNDAGNDNRPMWGRPTGGFNVKGTMIPTVTYAGTTFKGADRDVNIEKAKIFTLYEINFPTGGKHTYEYESNEYYNLNPITEIVVKSESLFPSITTCEIKDQASVACNSNLAEKTIEFEVTQDMVNKSPTHKEGYIVANFNFYIDGSINGCLNNSDLPTEGQELAHLYPIIQPGANFTGSTTLRVYYPNRLDLPYGCFENTDYYEYDSSFDTRCTNINDIGCSRDLSSVVLVPGWYKLKLNAKRNYLESHAEATFQQEESITNDGNQPGGGLRVSKITLDSGNNSPNIIKTYKYLLNDNVQSSGVLMSPPLYFKTNNYLEYATAGINSCVITCSYIGSYIQASSNSISPLSNAAKGNFVGYSNVKEYLSENGNENGFTEYVYKNIPDFLDSNFIIPGLPTLPNLDNGLLSDLFIYDKNVKKKKWDHFNYARDGSENILKGLTIHNAYIPSTSGNGYSHVNFSHFYDINYQWFKMVSKETIDYDDNENPLVTRKQNYVYNSNNKLTSTISEDIIEGGVSKTIETSYEYPQDFGTSGTTFGSNFLRDKKMYGQVLREKTLTNGLELIKKQNSYNLINDNALISEIRVNQKGDNNYSILNNIKYDNYSNPIEIERIGSIKTVAIYGYENQYPIAKGENISYELLDGAINWAVNNMTGLPNQVNNINDLLDYLDDFEDQTQRQVWNNFNTKLRDNMNIPTAMVTTYTYDPLIGITSVTDPRGYTIYYEYDDFNRLKEVKDADGNLVTDYDYHYIGQ